jgi:hypothetical protein
LAHFSAFWRFSAIFGDFWRFLAIFANFGEFLLFSAIQCKLEVGIRRKSGAGQCCDIFGKFWRFSPKRRFLKKSNVLIILA